MKCGLQRGVCVFVGRGGARARGREGGLRGSAGAVRSAFSGVPTNHAYQKAVHDGGAAQARKGYVSSVSKGQLWTSKSKINLAWGRPRLLPPSRDVLGLH